MLIIYIGHIIILRDYSPHDRGEKVAGGLVIFKYISQPPKRYTFEQPQLKLWVEQWCKGQVLNLFAGKVRLRVNETRIDIDREMKPHYICDAQEYVERCVADQLRWDTIILDPPYNYRKAREKYGGRYIGKMKKIKDTIPQILKTGGRVIHLGYDSVGMGNRRGFSKISICLVCHNGDHNDTICLVEELKCEDLFMGEKGGN